MKDCGCAPEQGYQCAFHEGDWRIVYDPFVKCRRWIAPGEKLLPPSLFVFDEVIEA